MNIQRISDKQNMSEKSRERDRVSDLSASLMRSISGDSSMSSDKVGLFSARSSPEIIDLEGMTEEEALKASTAKELRMLSFANPGPSFMTNFDPERSTREMRKVNRRIYRENVRKNQVYEDSGRLIKDNRDICDCLEHNCPGCHFPCPKCSSTKCAGECRCNRRWYYVDVEIEGAQKKFYFPDPPQ